jgi:hypothetical protein
MKRQILVATAAILASCSSRDVIDSVPAYAERDSAGITIVENRLEAAPGGWEISTTPSLATGGLDAPENEQLFRLTGAVRLADGRIALSNSGTGEIRILGADGALLATHGRLGDGPGEFQDARLLGVLGTDSLLVWDQDLQRVSLVHAEDGFARSRQVEWTGAGFPVARGMMADGSVLIGGGMSFSSEAGFPTGVIRPESTFGWADPGGREVHIGDFVAAEMFARADAGSFMARGLPFGRSSVAAAAPAGAWIGGGEAFEFAYYGQSGALERIFRVDAAPERVTDAHLEDYIQQAVDEETDDENRRREIRALIREMPIPERFPAYQAALVDSEGDVWVQDYGNSDDEAAFWTVFDSDGRIVGRLQGPARTRFLRIGPDYVLGQTTDEFDVESLTLWSLARPLAPSTR